MKTYTIGGTRINEVEEEFVANSIQEAIEQFNEEYPEFFIDHIDNMEVLSFDEFTDEPIFMDDDYLSNDDGSRILRKNLK